MPAAGVLGFDSGQLSLLKKRTRSPDPPVPFLMRNKDRKTRNLYRNAF